MMVTVRERTREIGVRRAIGAKPFDIISQIMSESLLLTSLAGLIGLSVGVFLLDVVNNAMASDGDVSNDTFFFQSRNPYRDSGGSYRNSVVQRSPCRVDPGLACHADQGDRCYQGRVNWISDL